MRENERTRERESERTRERERERERESERERTREREREGEHERGGWKLYPPLSRPRPVRLLLAASLKTLKTCDSVLNLLPGLGVELRPK